MHEFQKRVVEEKKELDIKRDKLTEFLKGDTFKNLSEEEQDRLNRQLLVMEEYSNILAERIVNFN